MSITDGPEQQPERKTQPKMVVLMYRPTIKIEVPFDDQHYPGMSVVEALQHEASKTVGDQVEEIIEHLSNTDDLGNLQFTVAATLSCFEDPISQVPDAHTMLASVLGPDPDRRVVSGMVSEPEDWTHR